MSGHDRHKFLFTVYPTKKKMVDLDGSRVWDFVFRLLHRRYRHHPDARDIMSDAQKERDSIDPRNLGRRGNVYIAIIALIRRLAGIFTNVLTFFVDDLRQAIFDRR